MRVLHVISSLDRRAGGIVTQLLGTVAAETDAGLSVSVLATFTRAERLDAVDELRKCGGSVEVVGPTIGPLRWHPRLAGVLATEIAKADVVHVHGLWEEIQHRSAAIARKRGTPYVVTPHGMLDPWSLAQRKLKKRIYLNLRLRADLNGAAAIHFTDREEQALVGPLHLRPKAVVEPCCTDLSEFVGLPEPGDAGGARQAVPGDRGSPDRAFSEPHS